MTRHLFAVFVSGRPTHFLFGLAILTSGFAAISYQVVWQRALTQAIGSDAVSVVLVVTIFMVWLGVGALLSKRLILRSRKKMSVAYAGIEIGIGLFGVVSVPLLRSVNGVFALTSFDSVWADFLINLALLSLPIIGMGMTTPMIVHVARRQLENLGRTVGFLYGLNILGAATGAIVCGLVFIEAFGLDGTTVLAGLLNGMAAGSALLAARSLPVENLIDEEPRPLSRVNKIDVAAVFFGFGTLALQVVFFRILHAYLTLSTIVFPIVLCAYLLLMASGQAVGGYLADRYIGGQLTRVVSILFAGGAVLTVLALKMPPDWAAAFGALRFTDFNGQLVPEYTNLIGDPPVIVAFVFSLIFMLAVVAWSAIFPVLLRIATVRIDDVGASFGRLYGLYTVGNVVGAFLTGVMLLSALGTGGAAVFTIVVVGLGCAISVAGSLPKEKIAGHGYVVFGFAASVLIPLDYYKQFQLGEYKVADVVEGRIGVATVSPTKRFYSIVDISRTASASALVRAAGPNDQYEAWRWNHTELMALDPSFRPNRVLVIGLGHAYLPDALLDHPFIQEIVIVDLSQEVVSAVEKHTATSTRRVFNDPRIKIVIADGRRYVQSALKRGEKFDLIQIKINEPWHAGSGNLFTIEFFALTKRLLSPNGYLGVRPLLGHLSDGMQVFGSAVYPGYYHLFFKNGSIAKVDRAIVSGDIRENWTRLKPGGSDADVKRASTMEVIYFDKLDLDLITDRNSDNRPTFEYYWLRQRLGEWKSPRTSLGDVDFDKYRKTLPVVTQ